MRFSVQAAGQRTYVGNVRAASLSAFQAGSVRTAFYVQHYFRQKFQYQNTALLDVRLLKFEGAARILTATRTRAYVCRVAVQ